jgi:hypothetical protein
VGVNTDYLEAWEILLRGDNLKNHAEECPVCIYIQSDVPSCKSLGVEYVEYVDGSKHVILPFKTYEIA